MAADLNVLAGPSVPTSVEPSASDFARLFDISSGQFHYSLSMPPLGSTVLPG